VDCWRENGVVAVRERNEVDYYSVLGVHPDASQDEIAATYRSLVKELHPDVRPGDEALAERFKRVTAAYRVLGDAASRQQYDRMRIAGVSIMPAPVDRSVGSVLRTRRSAQWAVGSGIALLVLGVVVGAFILALQAHDRSLRNEGVGALATVVQTESGRRLEFTTADGEFIRAREPLRTGTGDTPVGETVEIRYDPDQPGDIITDESKIARDVTLWIVAAKLIVGGAFFVWFGLRRLRAEDRAVAT
jgi:curved DNA-binding protein CbpA